jgi:hypothetical protein
LALFSLDFTIGIRFRCADGVVVGAPQTNDDVPVIDDWRMPCHVTIARSCTQSLPYYIIR